MSKGLILIALAAVLMMGAAWMLLLLGSRLNSRSIILRRLDETAQHSRSGGGRSGILPLHWIRRTLQRAGLPRRTAQLITWFGGFLLIAAYLIKGFWGSLATLSAIVCVAYLFIVWRAAANRQKLVQQLPGLIDQVIRIMGIGRSFDSALLQAIKDSPQPLGGALQGVVIESSLGGDLVEALRDAAQIYRMKELHLLTLALRINQRYGGSIKAMLESIIALIRRREQADRELRALTGETRLSAWLLGTMPVTMAGYMMITNPDYIGFLLNDPHGTEIICAALGLQVTGGLLLWRMMASVR